eukprot:TRINITY_DN5551_c0_g1_i1.p1 TRINITY_DN5551_c0_g1~~TRINITY_DN5551_c0_g1_i1.p1  ORF type:complete len:631 (+),score=193.97 TRINITY_DN5551_c0_g1_i1:66-1958(+)
MDLQEAQQRLIECAAVIEELKASVAKERDAATDAVMESGKRNVESLEKDVPEGYYKVKEGTAAVLGRRNEDGSQEVFYNPVQVVNRDLSTLAIRGYNEMRMEKPFKKGRKKDEGLRILEGLSATGLRAIRYWKEIPNVDTIIVNDLLPDAVDAINRNLEFNRCPRTKVIANQDDAVVLMQRLAQSSRDQIVSVNAGNATATPLLSNSKMDVVDLDPYGTAAPFLDSAIACAEEGGLLCVTCTDCDVLCGVHVEACHHKYGAVSVKAKYCHEMAVRILLGCIERHAIRHGKHIHPLLSLQIDFYCRVFVRVHASKAEAKLSIGKIGHIIQCSACSAFRVKPIGSVKVQTKSREERRNQVNEKKKGRKRKREELEGDDNPEFAAEEDEQVAEDALGDEETGDRPTAAVPGVPSRLEPRLKYGTATTVSFQSTFKPATVGCNCCGGACWIGGPIWSAPMHDKEYVERLIQILDSNKEQFTAVQRVRALLAAARDELPDVPLFYQMGALSSSINTSAIPAMKFKSALLNLGYRTSQVHCCPDGVKTDAPPEVVYDVVKAWHRGLEKEGKASSHKQNPSARKIMAAPTRVEVDFSFNQGAKKTGEKKWGKVYEPNWGPKPRAKGVKEEEGNADGA